MNCTFYHCCRPGPDRSVMSNRRLVAAVRSLLGDTDLAARLGRQGRRTIEERFDFRRRTAALEALYQSIVDVSRSQRGSLANAVDR